MENDEHRPTGPHSQAPGDERATASDRIDDVVDTGTPETATSTPPTPSVPRGLRLVVPIAAVIAATVTAVWLLNVGGGVITEAVLGLPPRDTTVTWLVPLLKLADRLLAVGSVGCLIAAAFFVDGDGGRIRTQAYSWLRIGGWTAIVWGAVVLVHIPPNSPTSSRPTCRWSRPKRCGALSPIPTTVV